MLSARAYSFRQQSKLAISLSWIAGYVNVALLLTCGAFVSHVTGNATHFGEAIARGNASMVVHFAWMIVSFWLGAVASAFMTESASRRGARSKYVLPMAAEGMLLFLLSILMTQSARGQAPAHPGMMAMLATFIMGLQNATITEISGAVIRTTHLTGVVTDFGLEGVRFLNWWLDRARGRWSRAGRLLKLSQRHPTAQRLGLLFCIFWSFIIGGACGAWMHFHHPVAALLPPASLVLWIIFIDWWTPIADVKELDPLSDPELKGQGLVRTLLPAELGLYRLTHHRADRAHRAPDFHQWFGRLPEQWRVVILAVSPHTIFNDNAALALGEVSRRLTEQERTLLVAGVTPKQYKVLNRNGLFDATPSENVCADLELAIARGIDLLRNQP